MALSRYRMIRDKKGDYAAWVARLAGVNGVYVIRRKPRSSAEAPIVEYVGESHKRHLRETLQRHFQRWNGKTAGAVFDDAAVEVAVEIVPLGDDAVRRQDELIRRFLPVYNKQIPTPPEPAHVEQDLDPAELEHDGGDYDTAAFDSVMSFFEELA